MLLVRSRHKISQSYKTREEELPIPLKAYAKPSKSELPLDEVAIFALSLPSIIKYKREKRLLIARGSSSSHSRNSRGVPLYPFFQNKRLHRA
jgi:hypothetical protein